jgi:hypothetical protein
MSGWIKFVRETASSYGIPYKEAMSVSSQFWPQVKNEPKYANKPRVNKRSIMTLKREVGLSKARKRGTIVPFSGKRTRLDVPDKAEKALGKLKSLAKLVGRVKPKLQRQKMEEFFAQAESGALDSKGLRTILKGVKAPMGRYKKF